jgi:hypothetical protein
MQNPAWGAVWVGPLKATWDELWPLHTLRGAEDSAQRFRYCLWPLGGALAVEPDGGIDVIVTCEPGVYRYGPDGRLREVLGAQLADLVGWGLKEAWISYPDDSTARYREIINRQPWVDDLVATPDGPAIVVRLHREGVTRWELWYPRSEGRCTRVELPFQVADPQVFLRAEARGARLAAVYYGPESGTGTQGGPLERSSWLTVLPLPDVHSTGGAP